MLKKRDYYSPFGLSINALSSSAPLSKPNKFKYHGQEEQTDFDLGWYQFKWRNHDPTIARFFNVDPLASDYVYNSPYAFAENKLGLGIELEGLELLQQRGSTVRGEKNGMKLHSSSRSYGVNSVHAVEFADNGGYSSQYMSFGDKVLALFESWDGLIPVNGVQIVSDNPTGDDDHVPSVTENDNGQHLDIDEKDFSAVANLFPGTVSLKGTKTGGSNWDNNGNQITMNRVARGVPNIRNSLMGLSTDRKSQQDIINLFTAEVAEPDSVPIIAGSNKPDVRYGSTTNLGYAKGDTIGYTYSKEMAKKKGVTATRRN